MKTVVKKYKKNYIIYIYIYIIMEQKGNKIKCKRKKDDIQKRYEINQRISKGYSFILNTPP